MIREFVWDIPILMFAYVLLGVQTVATALITFVAKVGGRVGRLRF